MTRMPLAKKEDLEVQELTDEILVYDLKRHRAHGLNKVAAIVWRYCDGKTSLSAMSAVLKEELHIAADAELVRFVLARLQKAHLLEECSTVDSGRYTRRELVKKLKNLGLAASVMLPVVTSIVSPTPAHAQTCIPHHDCTGKPNCTPCENPGGACEFNWMCCNGQCMPPGLAAQQCGC